MGLIENAEKNVERGAQAVGISAVDELIAKGLPALETLLQGYKLAGTLKIGGTEVAYTLEAVKK